MFWSQKFSYQGPVNFSSFPKFENSSYFCLMPITFKYISHGSVWTVKTEWYWSVLTKNKLELPMEKKICKHATVPNSKHN